MLNIRKIMQFLKPGWVAMDEDKAWYWFEHEPIIHLGKINKWLRTDLSHKWCALKCFDIAPADDWKSSLIKVDHKFDEIEFNKEEAENARKKLDEAQKDKSVLINLLLQAKPELQRWVEVHFHD